MSSQSDQTSGRAVRVLILEDEPIILMDIEHILEAAGFQPVTAKSSGKALREIEECAPDVALLDVNLGRGSTCEAVAERLRELAVPFALHTGDLERQGELVMRFDVPILAKPSSNDAIVQTVKGLCSPEVEPGTLAS